MNSEIVKSLDLRHFESCILHIKCKFYEEVPNLIGYEKPIIYLGGEYIGYRVKDNEKLAPDDNELCPMTKWSSEIQCLCGFPGSCYVV